MNNKHSSKLNMKWIWGNNRMQREKKGKLNKESGGWLCCWAAVSLRANNLTLSGLFSEMVSRAFNLNSHTGPCTQRDLGFTFCSAVAFLKPLTIFEQEAQHFHIAVCTANDVADAASTLTVKQDSRENEANSRQSNLILWVFLNATQEATI